MHPIAAEGGADDLLHIIDAADRRDGEAAERRLHQQRLRLGIRDAADAHFAVELLYIPLEFGAKRGVLDIMYGAVEAAFSIHGHSAPLGAEVGVVIGAEKQIQHTILFRNDAKNSAHQFQSFTLK